MYAYTTEAIVLKRSNLREMDKLITLFTREKGKVTLKAKGIRRPASRRAGSLELFNLVKISAVQGRGDLDILTEVQALNTFTPWRKHLGRVSLAYQLVEAADKLTPDHEPHPHLFDMLVLFLSQISSLDSNWKQVTDSWLVQILQELGYWPHGKAFQGDVLEFVEDVSSRPLNSPKLLEKLK